MLTTEHIRKFDAGSPITMCFSSETNPLIKVSATAIEYATKASQKQVMLMGREEGDQFFIAWSGKWRTDLFVVSEEDIQSILSPVTKA